MPRRKKNHNKNGRRRRGKGRRNVAGVNSPVYVPRSLGPFPRIEVATLRFSSVCKLNAGLTNNSIAYEVFRPNSIFAPYNTGTTLANTPGQPDGYDQLALTYNRYCVTKCRYKLTFPDLGVATIVVAPYNGAVTAPTTNALVEHYMNSPYGSYQQSSSVGNNHTMEFNGSFKNHKICGVEEKIYITDDRYQAVMTTNPTETINFIIVILNTDGNTLTFQFNVHLEYTVRIWDPITVADAYSKIMGSDDYKQFAEFKQLRDKNKDLLGSEEYKRFLEYEKFSKIRD